MLAFRDMAAGGAVKHIPISSLVKVDYTSTLGSVKRKNQKACDHPTFQCIDARVYTQRGKPGNCTCISANFKKKSEDVTIKQTGEGEQQAETGAFLVKGTGDRT